MAYSHSIRVIVPSGFFIGRAMYLSKERCVNVRSERDKKGD
jgi:hypothetical protein